MSAYLLLCIAIISEVIGTSALKATHGFTKFWPSILTVLAYCIAFYSLSLTVKTMPIGIAYASWSALGIVLIASIAWLIYDQVMDIPAIIGIALIITGVVIINIFSKTLS